MINSGPVTFVALPQDQNPFCIQQISLQSPKYNIVEKYRMKYNC